MHYLVLILLICILGFLIYKLFFEVQDSFVMLPNRRNSWYHRPYYPYHPYRRWYYYFNPYYWLRPSYDYSQVSPMLA